MSQPVPLRDFCQEIWDSIAVDDPDSHQFELVTPDYPVVACADPILLRTVLSNLFQNARKYAPVGTTVRVELSCRDKKCNIAVIDQGRGISSDEANLIFEPFYRGSNAAHSPGIGLGLAIVKTALVHMKGTISLTSGQGGGARFDMTLPREVS